MNKRRVMVTINLTSKCNYDCKYCCEGTDKNSSKFPELDPSVYVDFFKQYPDIEWSFIFLGGEPFLYKQLDELINSLDNIYQKILIITNFSSQLNRYDNIINAVKKREKSGNHLPKYKSNFHNIEAGSDITILASLHPQIENDRESVYSFMYKISYLKENGIDVIPTYVLDPSRLNGDRIFVLDELLKKNLNIPLSYLSFFGRFDDKLYPESYSEQEKSLIKELPLSKCNQTYAFGDCYFGKRCSAGYDSFFIHQNGDISRCAGKFSIGYGNILDKTLKLDDTPQACGKRCKCYSGRYFNETTFLD